MSVEICVFCEVLPANGQEPACYECQKFVVDEIKLRGEWPLHLNEP